VAEELLDCIPPHRTDDVAYFNPADLEYPVGLNPLQKTPRDRHHLVVDSIGGATCCQGIGLRQESGDGG
jgi:hypothetical protein